MEEKKFIGFDIGAESGRCVVALLSDNKLEYHEVHRFSTYNIKYEKGFYWDILAIYKEIITGLTNAQKAYGSNFNGIGFDTWAVDYVLIDSDERILGYPYHYRDDRTDGIMEKAFQIVSKNKIYNQVGIQFAHFNTLFQFLAEEMQNSSLLDIADKFLLIPDFLSFLLSGKKKAEFTNASTTSLVNPFKRDWCWELIDEFKLPRKIFPEIVEPGHILGNILPSIAKKTGLNPDTPVIATSSHDTASAVVSVPAVENSEWAFLSSGTWSLMGIELKHPLITSEAMDYNFTNEGGVENTTRFLKNIIGLWPVQECKRYWDDKSKNYSYTELVSLAKKSDYAKSWINLNDPRFLKAGRMPEKIQEYLRESEQTVKSDAGFIIRVLLESLAFNYRETLKRIEKVTGEKIKSLYVVGGGVQNELLTQLTADAINRDVYAGPIEGTIIGNIGIQAIAAGIVPNLKAWRNIVANSFELKIYKPVNTEYFNTNEKNYRKILKYSHNNY